MEGETKMYWKNQAKNLIAKKLSRTLKKLAQKQYANVSRLSQVVQK